MPLDITTPELAALDLFVSVVHLGSLSKAAQAHQIAQPSASSRMKNLERKLGLELLDRSPSGTTPTVAGSLVAGWAEEVIQSANQLMVGVAALKARREDRLRVAASFTVAEYLLPTWLEQFLRNRPDDSVELAVANSSTVIERLIAGEADLGFVESPEIDGRLRRRVVALDRLMIVVGRSHPWAKRGVVPLEAVATTPLVLRERGSGTRDALEAALAVAGYDPPGSALELGSTSAVRAAVVGGGPPTVISELAVAADLEAGSLVAIEAPGLVIERQLCAVWLDDQTLSDLARSLLERLPGPL